MGNPVASGEPALSVLLVTLDGYETLGTTLAHLRRQTIVEQLELVIAVPSRADANDTAVDLRAFPWVQVIEVGPIESSAAARARAAEAARASVVVLAEDHAFPDPEWAEALVRAHREPWAAVGPVLDNGNPESLASWSDMCLGYLPWLDPSPRQEVEHLPGHNSSYKRAVLLEYGDRLAAMLQAESVLHWDLRRRGHRLLLEPAARVWHVNISRLSSWLHFRFHYGRVFGAARAREESWSGGRRALYVGGGALIPAVRLRRMLREFERPGRPRHLLPRLVPLLSLGLVLDAAGQAAGYAHGAGRASTRLVDVELRRRCHLRTGDPARAWMTGASRAAAPAIHAA